MQSHAWVSVRARTLTDGTRRSFIEKLHSHQALVMRATTETAPAWASPWGLQGAVAARLVAGAAGPVGGDGWRWDIDVGSDAAFLLGAAGGTLVLPGPRGETSSSVVNVRVAGGGTLIWEPGVQIAAAGCRHQGFIHVMLEQGARLYLRDDVVLGRHAEEPGDYRQRLRITVAGRAIYDQTLAVGDAAPGWASGAVMGGYRTLGSLVVIDPEQTLIRRGGAAVSDAIPHTAVMPLDELGIVISSVDHTLVDLLRKLDRAFAHCREPRPSAAASIRPYLVPDPARTRRTPGAQLI
ncbi:urease accessory protein UreD [Castellaniella sp.]|uniref:urease accessory protein UreD n=1 Tax=Castellaniella sp. TaxID=1955812 RepID=UPI003C721296